LLCFPQILSNDFMKAGGSELKELRVIASFLAELPVVEQVRLIFLTSRDATVSLTVIFPFFIRVSTGNELPPSIGPGRTRFEKSAG